MSRSYKKTPVCKYTGQHSRKIMKKEANRKVRYYKENISNGKWYRKLFDSWEIDEYIFYSPYYGREELYKNKLDWEKRHKRK